MILTVTPNPTLDRAVFVRGFRLGAIVRAERELLTPSGKGVDGSLVLHALGRPTLATGLQAGRHGRMAVELLDALGVPHEFVWADGETRHALVLIDEAAGAQSTISAATLRAEPRHLAELLGVLGRRLPEARFAILAGSLPPGWPADAYCELIAACRASGVPSLLDTSGAALAALAPGGGTMPDIVKVNAAELASLPPGHFAAEGVEEASPPSDAALSVSSAARQASRLRQRLGNEAVVVTLGAQGAVAATGEGLWHVAAPRVAVVNDAGAGDALAACLAWGRAAGMGWPDALREGAAAAAAVVTTPGTAQCDPEMARALLGRVEVSRIG